MVTLWIATTETRPLRYYPQFRNWKVLIIFICGSSLKCGYVVTECARVRYHPPNEGLNIKGIQRRVLTPRKIPETEHNNRGSSQIMTISQLSLLISHLRWFFPCNHGGKERLLKLKNIPNMLVFTCSINMLLFYMFN